MRRFNAAWITGMIVVASLVTGLICAPPRRAAFAGQGKRDHLTEQEVDQVRTNQEIELRVDVFMKAADRRLLVLTNPQAIQKKKEEEIWGPLPKGTRIELLQDYRLILEELEEKMDDSLNRDGRNPMLEKAFKKMKESVSRQILQLRVLSPQLTDLAEQRSLKAAIDEAEVIVRATFSSPD